MFAGKCFLVLAALVAAQIILTVDADKRDERRGPKNPLAFLPSIAGCDATREGGWTCADCRTVKLCNQNNVSISFTCGFFQPHCNNGSCKSSPSDECKDDDQPDDS